ncbi:MAG: hypothetical protein ABSC50_04320 [Candidatus Bathyarchaeia archaeon]
MNKPRILHELSSALVSDILDELGFRGTISGLFPVLKGAKTVGLATPVAVRSRSNSTTNLREGIFQAIETSNKGAAIVIASETESCSCFGGLTGKFAKSSGVAGVVVYGAVRDTPEMVSLRLPVFTRSVTPISGYNRLEVRSVNIPVRCGHVPVNRDDLVIADSDGVAIVPKNVIDDVLERAFDVQAKEGEVLRQMRKRIKS